jgi:hypothetical protein
MSIWAKPNRKDPTAIPTTANGITLQSNGIINKNHLKQVSTLVIATAGQTLQLPVADHARDVVFWVFNKTAQTSFVHVADTFADGSETIALAPYEAVRMFSATTTARTWQWVVERSDAIVKSWTPVPTWSGGTPTVTAQGAYIEVEGTVFYWAKISSADGAGGTCTGIPLPITPGETDMDVPAVAVQVIGTAAAVSNAEGYVDQSNATEASRKLAFRGAAAWTDDEASYMIVSGFYEKYGWTAVTPSPTWGTADPEGSIVTTMRYKVIGDVVVGGYSYYATDGNDSDSFSLLPPDNLFPPDIDANIACAGIQLQNTTYTDLMPYLDAANATEGSRDFAMGNFTTAANARRLSASTLLSAIRLKPGTLTLLPWIQV